jgi:ParB-like chromosome segregation protein Spo0J
MSGKEYEDLKQSLREHGQQQPVILRDQVLIDGRNRLRALLELGMEPVFQEYAGTLPIEDFILTQNLFRRHLTDDQRMMITTSVMYRKETDAALEREKSGTRNPAVNSTQGRRAPTVTERIADVARGTDYQARQAVAVLTHAPDLVADVQRGKQRLREAAKQAQHRHKRPPRAPDRPARKRKPRPEVDIGLLTELLEFVQESLDEIAGAEWESLRPEDREDEMLGMLIHIERQLEMVDEQAVDGAVINRIDDDDIDDDEGENQ